MLRLLVCFFFLQESAEVRISDPDMYQEIVDAEWTIIYDKLEK